MDIKEQQILYNSLEDLPRRIVLKNFKHYDQVFDDLIQEGKLALWIAIPQYDASQGADIRTYVGIRIRGSVIDYLRKNPPFAITSVSRGAIRRKRDADEEVRQGEQRANRCLTSGEKEEITQRQRKTSGAIFWEAHALAALYPTREARGSVDPDSPEFTFDKVSGGPFQPPDVALEEDVVDRMIVLLSELARGDRPGLSSMERDVLTAMIADLDGDFFEEDNQINLRLIGAALSVSESRICQILNMIGRKVRANWVYE